MKLEAMQQYASQQALESPLNHVQAQWALSTEIVGERLFDPPLIGISRADDAYFSMLKEPSVIGPHHLLPRQWLPGANSVISFFFPASKAVRETNRLRMDWPSDLWVHARIEGQEFLKAFIGGLRDMLIAQGHPSIAPMISERFLDNYTIYSSNWSERHAAFASGLGTFSLSRGLITKKGMAGRFTSLITAMEIPATKRPYSHYMEYCTLCGACAVNCQADAISIENGKDQVLCSRFVGNIKKAMAPRYGCGKCQVKVPCEYKIP